MTEYRTKSGKVLTDADIEALADDAETNPKVREAVQRGADQLVSDGLIELDEARHAYVLTEYGRLWVMRERERRILRAQQELRDG